MQVCQMTKHGMGLVLGLALWLAWAAPLGAQQPVAPCVTTTGTPFTSCSPVTSTNPLPMTGSGTAGTSAAAVVTVQGIAGGTTLPVTITQSSTGITPVVSTAAESGHVLKASAGVLWGLTAATGASAGFVMVFNATSAPVDGAVTPIECLPVAANSAVAVSFAGGPAAAYSTGITVVFSTTGCFTKTASATAFFSGKIQ